MLSTDGFNPIVIIYSGPNYSGQTLKINFPCGIMNVKAIGWNDNVGQSLRIFRPNVTVTLYTNFDYKNDKNKQPQTFRSNSNPIGKDNSGLDIYYQTPDFGSDYNNRLSSFTVDITNFSSVLSIYEAKDYGYSRASFDGPVNIPSMNNIPFPNKVLSSLTLREGYILTLYSEPNFGGASPMDPNNFTSFKAPAKGQFIQFIGPVTISDLNDKLYEFNDKTQSFSLQPYNPVGKPGPLVTFYQDAGYGKKQRSYYTSMEVPDITMANYPNDMVSSIKVAPGVIIELYRYGNFQNQGLVLSGGIKGLEINSLNKFPYDYNDLVTSFKITAPRYPLTGNAIKVSIGQKTVYNPYGKSCKNGDWKVGKNNCSSLDPNVCPLIGGVKPQLGINWSNPYNNNNSTMAPVDCIYDISQFKSADDYNTFLKYIVADPTNTLGWINSQDALNTFDTILMPPYCTQQVNTCPPYPGATGPIKCSRFVSTGPDGEVCRNWIQRGLKGGTPPSITPSTANTTMLNYCAKNTTPECQCLNSTLKQQDPAYKIGLESLSGLNPNDACWYGPCSTTDPKYLRTSDMINPPCANLCINQTKLQNLTAGKNISIDNITLQNICPGSEAPVTPAPGVTPVTPAPGVTPEPSASPSSTTKGSPLPWILIGVGVLIVLVIIGVIIFFVIKK